MKEYILVPNFFSIDKVDCKPLEEFLKTCTIEDNKISLSYFRNYYKTNHERGILIRHELLLRGFKFKTSRPNNFLKNIENEFNFIEVIYTDKNNGKLSSINRKIFNNFNFNMAESDFYFNLIPLYIFRENYLLAKSEFKRYGFKIIKIDNYLNSDDIYLKNILDLNKIGNKNIISYLEANRIFTLSELKNKKNFSFEELLSLENVGIGLVNDFKKLVYKDRNYLVKLSKENIKKNNMTLEDLLGQDVSYLYSVLEIVDKNRVIYNRTKTDNNVLTLLKELEVNNLFSLLRVRITDLKKVKGVGNSYIENLVERIRDVILKIKEDYERICNFKLKENLKTFTLNSIYSVLYKKELKEDYKFRNKTLEEYDKVSISSIDELEERALVFQIFSQLSLNLMDTENHFNIEKMELISERDIKIITIRYGENRTLEEIGQIYNISRERVRQIVQESIRSINSELKRRSFYETLRLSYLKNKYLDYTDLRNFLGSKSKLLLLLIYNNEIDNLYSLKEINRIYFIDSRDVTKYSCILSSFLENIPNKGKLDLILCEKLRNSLGELNQDELVTILESNNFHVYKNYYFKNSPNNMDFLTLIFRDYIDLPLEIDSYGVEKLDHYYKKLFGISIVDKNKDTVRNVISIISRIDDIYLVGPKTFMHKDNIELTNKDIEVLHSVLLKFKDYSIINAEYIYSILKSSYPKTKFISKHHLYSYVKDNYRKEYKGSQGNELDLIKKNINIKNLTNEDLLCNLCMLNGGIITIDKAKSKLTWSSKKIKRCIESSENLLELDKNIVCLEYILSNHIKDEFIKVINETMKEGFTTKTIIAEELKFNKKIFEFLSTYNLFKVDILEIINVLDLNIQSNRGLLYKEESKIKSIEDLIMDKTDKYIYREELLNLLDEYKLSRNESYIVLKKLTSEGKIVQIEDVKYIKEQYFNIEKKVIEIIEKLAKESIESLGYFIPSNHLDNIILRFGYIEEKWTQHLVASILEKKDYKILYRYRANYRTDILVLVESESEFNDIGELVHFILKNNYRGSLSEKPVYDYLAELGFYRKEEIDSNKKLKVDISYKGLISIDKNYGRISLK